MTTVRTRFAPSPTGLIHVGGLRTNMFAWLLARQSGGKFVLRIEDTDQQRRVAGAIRAIVEDLIWFGMDVDEGPSTAELEAVGEALPGYSMPATQYGPYIQSLRTARYREVADQLIERGYCYRCDCTPEQLEQERQGQIERNELPGYGGRCRDRRVSADCTHTVRLRLPDSWDLALDDLVMGRIVWDQPSLRDPVLLKSDGLPLYHLANVVDDHDMEITHVLRGSEWMATTPLHLLLYQALGWKPPFFAHLPAVLGKDGKKLSKRHGATALRTFREQGYLPEALFNYLALLGWSPGEGEEQEIFSREELVKRFSIERVNRAGAVFDEEKLLWMNGVYIRSLPPEDFIARSVPFIEQAGFKVDLESYRLLAPHLQERAKRLTDLPEMVDFLFSQEIKRDLQQMFKKGIDQEKAAQILSSVAELFEGGQEFSVAWLEEQLRGLAERLNLKVGPTFGVIRIAITGKAVSPPLFESMLALGRKRALKRIQEAYSQVVQL